MSQRYERPGESDGYHDYGQSPSRSNLYPPYGSNNNQYSASQDSLSDAPLSNSGAPMGLYGATASEKMAARDRDNPYSQNYKSGGGCCSGRGKWWAIAIVVLALAGAGAGIAVWRVQANKSTSSSSSGSGGTTNSGTKLQYIDGTARVVKSNPQDPSDFERDSRLHLSFHGIAYTPFLSQEPWCGAAQANVTEDIQLLSQLTTRIRMYGGACNQTQMVLQAIEDTKANLTVWIGAYIGDNTTVNAQQQQEAIDALKIYGTDHVSGVIIGNEYLLNNPNTLTAATSLLVTQMANFRTALKALDLPKTLPVGTADAGSMATLAIMEGSDFFMANVHPYFGGLAIDDAAAWTNTYYRANDLAICNQASNKPTCFIAETGWPTDSMTTAGLTYEGATAGVPQLQTFLDTFVCAANTNGTEYFFFSPWDEPWKDQFGTVEPYWGLGDSNKIWHNLTFPDCDPL